MCLQKRRLLSFNKIGIDGERSASANHPRPLAFSIALELNLDEAKDFVGRASFALSHSSQSDIIVEYFIEREEYNIFTINETLFAFGQPILA